jgi:hypothetical protein
VSNNNSTNSGNIPTIGIGKMSLGSRYNTPRRGVVGLPGDGGDDDAAAAAESGVEGMVVESQPEAERGGEADRVRKVLMVDTTNGRGGGGVVVVGGGDGDGERERGVGGMDVDG